jgi:hypothetical protein
MRKIQNLILIIIILFSCKKEENINTSQNIFTGSPDLIIQTEDLNIVTCLGQGSIWNFNILKTDTSGNKIWEKQYSYNDDLNLKKMIPLNNNEFLIAMNQCAHYSDSINDYVRLLCIEGNGNVKWEKKIDLIKDIEFKDICLLPTNKFILCGQYVSYNKFYYCEIDENQHLNWIKSYMDSLGYCQVRQVMFENDSINILGSINANRILLIRTDKNGNISHQKELQINANQFYFSEKSTELIIVDNSKSGNLGIDKINAEGNLVWQKIYNIPDCHYADIIEMKISNNSYIILGNKKFHGIGEPPVTKNFLLKTSYDGIEIWQKTIKDENDIIRCIDVLESKNIISGISNSLYENPGEITFYLEIIKE